MSSAEHEHKTKDKAKELARDLARAKAELRPIARARRRAAAEAHGAEAAERLAAHGLALLADRPPGLVSGYWPIRHEIDPRPLLMRLAEAGWGILLPAIVEEAESEHGRSERGRTMVFRRCPPGSPRSPLEPFESMEPGAMGIPEPPATCPVAEPQVLLVPLLAFDARGWRLGYGGGFYDAKLRALHMRAGEPVLAIGLAFDEQELEAVPHGTHDERLDLILTPTGPRTIEGPSH